MTPLQTLLDERAKEFDKAFPRDHDLFVAGKVKVKAHDQESILQGVRLGLAMGREEIIELLKEHAEAVRLADKTPKYGYSRKPRDANNAGKFTEEAGARWSMPWELAASLVNVVRHRLEAKEKELGV